MKHKINRILCILLTVLLCVGCLNYGAIPVAAESGTCGDNLTWTLANSTLTISGSGAMTNYTERALAPWNDLTTQIQRIVISEGVTSVGNMAFYACKKVTTVTLSTTVASLGELAFAGCTLLAQINLNSVKSIGRGCFFSCESLANVILPDGIVSIGNEAFYRCKRLGGITVPASVTSFGESVFTYCSSLVYARIDAQITTLPYWTFYGCQKLNQLYLPSSLSSVGQNAVVECPDLHHVDYDGSAEVKEEIQEQLDQAPISENDPTFDQDVTYTETPGASITTTDKTQTGISNAPTTEEEGVHVDATVTDSSGWEDVSQSVEDTMNTGRNPTVNIQVQGNVPMPEGALNDLADKEVVVNIHTSENVDWQVIMRDQNADTLKGTQNFAVSLSKNEQGKYTDVIGSAESYTVALGDTTLNSTILVPLGIGTARKVATLYVVDGNELRKLSSVIVDDDGKAAFHVAGTEAGDYVIALDVQNIPQEEVRIPQKLASEYDITYGATLMDAYGNQYVLTGRVNKMGFGIGTLTLIVVGVLVGSGILVGVVMVIWNKQKMKFERTHRTKKR